MACVLVVRIQKAGFLALRPNFRSAKADLFSLGSYIVAINARLDVNATVVNRESLLKISFKAIILFFCFL